MKKRIAKKIVQVSYKITEKASNSACVCFVYQDKLPAKAKKLRKF